MLIGHSSKEAEKLIKQHGLNELKHKKKKSAFIIFLSQFNDFMVWVLIGATIISGLMGDKADAITILIIIIINGLLGFIQEYRTEKSLDALKELAAPTCKVYRDGKITVINSLFLTIDDIVVLEAGDRIPADGIFLETSNIVIDESLLTGESVGINKDSLKNNEGYMGTTMLKGRGIFKVESIGMNTKMGKIANLLDEIKDEKSPLKERLEGLGKILIILCLIVCAMVTIIGIVRGNDFTEMFLLGVSLAVAAIPEGLAAIVTVSLALGVSRMLKKDALVRKLPAVETLGCTSVICSDKTGTLTQNKMTVKEVYFNGRVKNVEEDKLGDLQILKKALVYCNDCNYDFKSDNIDKALNGDPTETALIKLFFKDVKKLEAFIKRGKRLYDVPFDSNRKMMSVIIKEDTIERAYVKGAPEKILGKCKYIIENDIVKPLTNQRKKQINSFVESMSSRALRCIAAAYKEKEIKKNESIEEELIFIGFVGSIDPPRKEAREAVVKCKNAGIIPVMITGDHKNTALAIAKALSICSSDSQVITGEEINKLTDEALESKATNIRVFARVSPEDKLKIVRAFKNKDNVVAMTGDGVNDAPAIKEADIGISMGISGTDVTKEAADMILMDDNFSTIVSAVEEGRVIYDNIRKFIRYLLSCNLGEVLTMFLATLFALPTPLLPIQILLINLATDGLPAIALGVDPPDSDIMRLKPRERREGIFSRGLVEKITIRGSLIGICTLLSFIVSRLYGADLEGCRTIALSTLILSQLFHVFECRSERHSIFEIKVFTNKYLLGAVFISIIMLLMVLYVPFFQAIFHTMALQLKDWLIVLAFSGTIFFINSLYLYIKRNRNKKML